MSRNVNLTTAHQMIILKVQKPIEVHKQDIHTATKFPFMYSFSGNCAASEPISTFMCLWAINTYSQDRSTYFPAAEKADRSWKYINLSQIYECRNWETGPYNSVLEITVSFLEIHKWEPDIYIGLSQALHLQCISVNI